MIEPQPTAPAPQAAAGPAEPIRGSERITEIDVVRGFAIFGILVVNMPMFFSPMEQAMSATDVWDAPWDRMTESAITLLARGKFYALFSFLFGVGLAMQLLRAERRSVPVARFFARRMLALLAIGLAHALLLWYGDILVMYALLGLLLIPFRHARTRTLVVWSAVLLLVPVVLMALGTLAVEVAQMFPESAEPLAALIEESRAESLQSIAATTEAYATGGLREVFVTRLGEWGAMLGFGLLVVGPQLLALFLLGFVVSRSGLPQRLDAEAPRLRRWLPWLAAGGVAGSVLMVVGERFASPDLPSLLGLLAMIGLFFGAPALGLAYAAGLLLLLRDAAWRRRLAPLAPVGRMALTNYLIHSVVFTTLAYGYGGGLYGKVSPLASIPLTLAMFAVQLPLSAWWLARYRFGPVEWLWRSLTYGALQPMHFER